MGGRGIRKLSELRELYDRHSPANAPAEMRDRRRPGPEPPPPERELPRAELVLPAPREGITYSQGEVAELCGVALTTVTDWACRGVICDGDCVRLPTMRVPRGHVAPGALAVFLEAVNDVKVKIERSRER